MILGRHDLHGLTGVYAVDALAGAERDQFELHLNRCQQCANEVRGFRETTTRLALAVAATPPAGLRERVLAAVAITRQLPPEVPEAAARRSQPSRSARSIGRGWYPRLATAVAVAALAAAVALGITQATTQHQLNQAQAQNQAVASVLAAPDAQLASRSTLAGGLATVVVSRSRHALVITTSGLPALTGGNGLRTVVPGAGERAACRAAPGGDARPDCATAGRPHHRRGQDGPHRGASGRHLPPHHHAHPGHVPPRLTAAADRWRRREAGRPATVVV